MRFNKGMTVQKFEALKGTEGRVRSIHQAISITGRAYVGDIATAYEIAKKGILLGADVDTLRDGLKYARRYSATQSRGVSRDYNQTSLG